MKIRRQLSCNYHSYKEAKQGSKKWLKAREVSEPSHPLGSYQFSHTEEQVITEAAESPSNTCGDYGTRKKYVIFFFFNNAKVILEENAKLVYILPKPFKNVQAASPWERHKDVTHGMAAPLKQMFYLSDIWQHWVQLCKRDDEQVPGDKNIRNLGWSEAWDLS